MIQVYAMCGKYHYDTTKQINKMCSKYNYFHTFSDVFLKYTVSQKNWTVFHLSITYVDLGIKGSCYCRLSVPCCPALIVHCNAL